MTTLTALYDLLVKNLESITQIMQKGVGSIEMNADAIGALYLYKLTVKDKMEGPNDGTVVNATRAVY